MRARAARSAAVEGHRQSWAAAFRWKPISRLRSPISSTTRNSSSRRTSATLALLKPESAKSLQGMFMVEPYDPRKIPVLMVHGLWSSPDHLDGDVQRPAFISRDSRAISVLVLSLSDRPAVLDQRSTTARRPGDWFAERSIPSSSESALDQMVLVGHSMGGLVSKLQTVESGDEYWQLLTDRPFAELKADDETRERLATTVFFQPKSVDSQRGNDRHAAPRQRIRQRLYPLVGPQVDHSCPR